MSQRRAQTSDTDTWRVVGKVLQEAPAPQVEGAVAGAEVTSWRQPESACVSLVFIQMVQDDFGLAQDHMKGQLLRGARRDRRPAPSQIAGKVLHRPHHRQPPRGRLPVTQGGKVEQEAVLTPVAVFVVLFGAFDDAVTEAEQVVPAAVGHMVGSRGEQVRRLGSQDRSQCPGWVLVVVVEVTAVVAVRTIGRRALVQVQEFLGPVRPGPGRGQGTGSGMAALRVSGNGDAVRREPVPRARPAAFRLRPVVLGVPGFGNGVLGAVDHEHKRLLVEVRGVVVVIVTVWDRDSPRAQLRVRGRAEPWGVLQHHLQRPRLRSTPGQGGAASRQVLSEVPERPSRPPAELGALTVTRLRHQSQYSSAGIVVTADQRSIPPLLGVPVGHERQRSSGDHRQPGRERRQIFH